MNDITLDPDSIVLLPYIYQDGWTITITGNGQFYATHDVYEQVRADSFSGVVNAIDKRMCMRAAAKFKVSVPVWLVYSHWAASAAWAVPGIYIGVNRRNGAPMLKSSFAERGASRYQRLVYVLPESERERAEALVEVLTREAQAKHDKSALTGSNHRVYMLADLQVGNRGWVSIEEANAAIREHCRKLGQPLPDEEG